MGSAMLRKPRSLAKMVAGVAAASELPVTVKVRGGCSGVGHVAHGMYGRHTAYCRVLGCARCNPGSDWALRWAIVQVVLVG